MSRTPRPEGPAFVAWIAYGHDTYHYHFDNPSRFNTPDNVPHFFEQNSSVNAAWLRGRARYHFAGRTWETEAGVAPPVTTTMTGPPSRTGFWNTGRETTLA